MADSSEQREPSIVVLRALQRSQKRDVFSVTQLSSLLLQAAEPDLVQENVALGQLAELPHANAAVSQARKERLLF